MNIQFPNNSFIEAETIELGKNFEIGSNVRIKVKNRFFIGDHGRFGNNVSITARDVYIGKHFYHYTDGLNIGGGGSQFPDAVLQVGDRCVVHNNYINLAREVIIGNDVGLSPDVQILTHGFWNSVLEGYPTKYLPVFIKNGVIVGQRSMILPGVYIAANVVVGANSTVTNSLNDECSVYAGSPAKFIRKIVEPTLDKKIELFRSIVFRYMELSQRAINYNYPYIWEDGTTINVETKEIIGTETDVTDKLRDFLRRYGIRIYTERGFKSL